MLPMLKLEKYFQINHDLKNPNQTWLNQQISILQIVLMRKATLLFVPHEKKKNKQYVDHV